MEVPQLLTTGRLAVELRQSVRRVQYVLATRPHIQPSAFAGNIRLYDSRAKAMILHEINAMDARRAESESVPC